MEYFRKASVLDPTSTDLEHIITALLAKKYDEGLARVEEQLMFHPENIRLLTNQVALISAESADLGKFRDHIELHPELNVNNSDSRWLFEQLAEYERDFEELERILHEEIEHGGTAYDSAQNYTGLAYSQVWSEGKNAASYADSGIMVLESLIARDVSRVMHLIADALKSLLYTLRGENERARRLADSVLAVDLRKEDATNAWTTKYYCCLTLIRLGERDRVFDLIDELLTGPSYVELAEIKYSPRFDPLRDHPRFQALIEKYEKDHGT